MYFPGSEYFGNQQPVNYDPKVVDREFLSSWNDVIRIRRENRSKVRNGRTISEHRTEFRTVIDSLKKLETYKDYMMKNKDTMSVEEWERYKQNVEIEQRAINAILSEVDSSYIEVLRAKLIKRSAKRKRIRNRKAILNDNHAEALKKRCDLSFKIDENLQNLALKIEKVKQEEKMKRNADITLRDVLRKKMDAKKNISLLEELKKLRKARANTAKGRGLNVPDIESNPFSIQAEELICLWKSALMTYEKEESDLRLVMGKEMECESKEDTVAKHVEHSIAAWKRVMFGESRLLPQKDFAGNMGEFIKARAQWDQYISPEGTKLPIGWLIPSPKDTEHL